MPPVPVTSYLRYLHEVSRKIVQRAGFENLLYRKAKQQNPGYFDFDRPSVHRPAYLRSVCLQLQERAGRGLFLGLGLLAGHVTKGGKTRNLASPLIFCPVQLEPEEDNPTEVNSEILWDGISLNYDLLTALLEEGDEECDDVFAHPIGSQNRIPLETLRVLSNVERELLWGVQDPVYHAQLKEGPKLRELMKIIHDNIAEFSDVSLADERYEHQRLEDYVKHGRPTFFSHRYFFLAPVADQLSTSVALLKLIRQVGQNGIR